MIRKIFSLGLPWAGKAGAPLPAEGFDRPRWDAFERKDLESGRKFTASQEKSGKDKE